MLKGSEVINDFSKVDVFVFDKTGTLTIGKPEVSSVKSYSKDYDKYLSYLKMIEKESDHPLAKAIVNYIDNDTNNLKVEDTKVIKGGGITASINGDRIVVGNLKLMENEKIAIKNDMSRYINHIENEGNSVVITAVNKEVVIIMGIKDIIRNDVKQEINKLKRLGVKELIVLSGDNQSSVDLVSKELGLTKAYGNMLPEDKQAFIKDLQEKGLRVAFVGDGVNDAPSLATANIGIAMGSGTDVAIETSDVVLINSKFSKLNHALGLAKSIVRNMWQNIIIALLVVSVLIISLITSDWMNMSIGMLVHEGSILVVIINGIRLLNYKLRK